MKKSALSTRGQAAQQTSLRVDMDLYFKAAANCYDPEHNPDGAFPLNVAENRLNWAVLKERIQEMTRLRDIPDWVCGYTNSLGAPQVRETVAEFLERFLAHCPVDPDCLGFSAGSTSVIEMTAFILAEAGDVAVFPAPCYPVYTNDIGNFPGVERYDLVTHDHLSEIARGPNLNISHLEQARGEIHSAGKRFKMLVLTNPDNPTGGMYSGDQLLAIADWCLSRKIHLIVNEIYALSLIDTQHPLIAEDYAQQMDFYAFARIMQEKNSNFLHLWYAFSKDFGISGFRFGLVYSRNAEFIQAYQNLNLSHTISNSTQWLMQLLLEDPSFVRTYIQDNQRLLTESYVVVVQKLKELKIPYVPARGSLFVWVDLSEFISADTVEAEMDFWMECYQRTGILLTPGIGFGHPRRGRFRVVHAYFPGSALEVAMQRFSDFVHSKR